MARKELTDAFIRSQQVESRTEFSDTRETGLMLRVFPSGTKTFAFRLRGPQGKIQGAVIGQYPDVRLAYARERAAELRRQVRAGADITVGAQKAAAALKAELIQETPTLDHVLVEYEAEMSTKRKIWQRTKTGRPSEAYHRITSVFGAHLQTRLNELTLADFVASMKSYRPESGKSSANGQVSRARAYLMPVLDWCAWRNKFSRFGQGRPVRVDVADLRQTHDPAADDHTIKGKRDRALDHKELGKILPLLTWPAPECLNMKAEAVNDLRPIALRFLLLSCARLDELVSMTWRDFRESLGTWHKPYVKTVSGPPRQQILPLSEAAINLLRSLPNFPSRNPDDLVFPNLVGGRLGNWTRITSAIHRESDTSGWHRHDLRRTGATIMKLLGVAPRVIDEILAHNASNDDEGTSRALENYFGSQNLHEHIEDPQKAALDRLAETLRHIEATTLEGKVNK